MLHRNLVRSGAQLLAPGNSHTLSGSKERNMCPGPLPRGFISSEENIVGRRQNWPRWTVQLRRVLVWNMTQGYIFYEIFNTIFISGRFACAIPDPDNEEQLIITGGKDTLKTVSVYKEEAGWQRDLTPLNQGRYAHACGSYVHGGKKVAVLIHHF